jgi:hypothetical protein
MRQIFLIIFIFAASRLLASDFSESEVVINNDDAHIALAGTLTTPNAGKPRAMLVLATGSGQQNRDEEILGHKPFKVIAEYLSAKGYAVLRMDDRGIGGSGGDFAASTADDFKGDIKCGIDYLRKQYPGVKAGVLGHSEGGSVAIMTGSGESAFADFIITLAAPAWSGDSIVMSQARAIAVTMLGRWDNESLQRQLLDIVKSPLNSYIAQAAVYSTLAKSVGDAAKIPAVQEQLSAQTKALLSPDYRRMIRYNPEADIRAVDVPWLALNGDKDCQVLVGNLTTIKELNQSAEVRVMEGHNHLFQHCITGLVDEYQTNNEDISNDTLSVIAEWLNRL